MRNKEQTRLRYLTFLRFLKDNERKSFTQSEVLKQFNISSGAFTALKSMKYIDYESNMHGIKLTKVNYTDPTLVMAEKVLNFLNEKRAESEMNKNVHNKKENIDKLIYKTKRDKISISKSPTPKKSVSILWGLFTWKTN